MPLPGQYWPEQNAHYAGIATDGKRHWHILVPAEQDLPKGPWGEYGQDIPGAQSRFDGHANTLAMAEAGSPLAITIRALPGDCYLPSQAEAMLCAATMPQIFQPGYHWTSSQTSRHYAYVQDFELGYSYWDVKDFEFRAVAVRRILIGE